MLQKQNKTKQNNGLMKKSKRKSENNSRQMKKEASFTNLWEAAKTVIRRKFIAIEADLKTQEKSQTT